jgi:putative membrane protein insertion efficiency factor
MVVRAYQVLISPFFPASCRYYPSCSEYAVESLRMYGPLKGSMMALRRISRCHPWGGSGIDLPGVPGTNEAGGERDDLPMTRSQQESPDAA